MKSHPEDKWRRTLDADAAALGTNLVSAWCALNRRDGLSLVAAAAELSAEAGRRYSANFICRMRRGDAPVPEPAAHLMRLAVLRSLIGDACGSVLLILEPPARR